MATLDSKKNGRYIKKGDALHKVLSITDFSLSDICETPITFHDNASANIIHEKLHLKEDLAETVRASHELETIFTSPEERMIIRPLDFTEEWARLRKRQTSRTLRSEDDDDFEIDANRNENPDEEDEESAPPAMAQPEEFGPGGLLDLPQDPKSKPANPPVVASSAPVAATPVPAPIAPIPELAPIPEAQEDMVGHEDEMSEETVAEDDFVPYASPHASAHTRASALERYPTEEELEAIRAAAREEGYRQGYQTGEERATIEARGKVQAILEEVSNIVENLEGMQGAILKSAQENFHVITQNLIESMLHKEFQINPESFGSVIERAVDEALSGDEFKIFVNPKIAKELKNWSNQNLLSRVKPDEALADYDFRVEGQHASIDASIKQIVGDLLEQADLSLFESKEKVG